MAPTAPALAQSDSKSRFMKRLGLDEGDKMHRYLYSLMKTEAADGWARMTANRDALIPWLKNDPAVEPPYTFSQLDETAVHNEVLNIYRTARPETKIMYRLGHDQAGDHEENWIIRWLLWHVFRYRDERNSGSARKRSQSTSPNIPLEDDSVADEVSEAIDGVPVEPAAPSTSHEGEQRQRDEPASITTAPTSTMHSRYWDPIRDDFRS